MPGLGGEVRRGGVANGAARLTAYASREAHGCIGRALDFAGLGGDALRLIRSDHRRRIDLGALADAIAADRAAGYTPFLGVGTAGTVDTGAVDDLEGMAALCRREKLWFHVDGAYGALAMLAPELAPRLRGIALADSLAFDFHKWGQVPYDAGFILVRDGELHRQAFSTSASYLKRETRGLAAGSPWPCDFGLDLSRGFRALKTWFTFKVHGAAAMGAAIARTCALARYLESRIASTPELELMAPVGLNIVCFPLPRRMMPTGSIDRIVVELQESGTVAPSTTVIGGQLAIRAAIVNHRTGQAEIDMLLDRTLALGRRLKDRAAARRSAPKVAAESLPRSKWEAELQEVERRLASDPGSVDFAFDAPFGYPNWAGCGCQERLHQGTGMRTASSGGAEQFGQPACGHGKSQCGAACIPGSGRAVSRRLHESRESGQSSCCTRSNTWRHTGARVRKCNNSGSKPASTMNKLCGRTRVRAGSRRLVLRAAGPRRRAKSGVAPAKGFPEPQHNPLALSRSTRTNTGTAAGFDHRRQRKAAKVPGPLRLSNLDRASGILRAQDSAAAPSIGGQCHW